MAGDKMSVSKKNIFFRKGYMKSAVERRNISNLDIFQLSPKSPYSYVERYNVLSSKDIVEVKSGCDQEERYYVTIEFVEDAIRILNQIYEEEKFPILVMFIEGVPFYKIHLRGPFEKPIVRWDVVGNKDEIDLLVSIFSKEL